MTEDVESKKGDEGVRILDSNKPDGSGNVPIILVSGFLGPGNEHWCKLYWGEAMKLGTESSPVFCAPVSCVGSAHDRACELFAQILGARTDYGEEHYNELKRFGHKRYGKDYSGKGLFPQWSCERPVSIVGHSFGGNTSRVFRWLVATDYFNMGTDQRWIRSVTTISSPLKGSLLTYKLGAQEDHNLEAPVRRFSVGYMIGLGSHAYELLGETFGLKSILDLGLSHYNVADGGLRLLCQSFLGGENGGGTPSVCSRDNAAHDMTIEAALEWNKKIRKVMEGDDHLFEFNFVARRTDLDSYSPRNSATSSDEIIGDFENRKPSSFAWSLVTRLRDFAVHFGARQVMQSDFDLRFRCENFQDSFSADLYIDSGGDGLCSGIAQYENENEPLTERDLDNDKLTLSPGQFTVLMSPHHDHFSVIPFPNDHFDQRLFFKRLFKTLRRLPARPSKLVANPNE